MFGAMLLALSVLLKDDEFLNPGPSSSRLSEKMRLLVSVALAALAVMQDVMLLTEVASWNFDSIR